MSIEEIVYDNRTILEKADLALADLTAGGGLLQPAQAQKFIRILIQESVVLKMSTVVPMRSQKQLIEKIRFGGRILRAGNESTALAAGDRVKPDLGSVELDAQLFKAEVRLNNEVLEDSIERGALRQTIMQLMADSISRDMDEVINCMMVRLNARPTRTPVNASRPWLPSGLAHDSGLSWLAKPSTQMTFTSNTSPV